MFFFGSRRFGQEGASRLWLSSNLWLCLAFHRAWAGSDPVSGRAGRGGRPLNGGVGRSHRRVAPWQGDLSRGRGRPWGWRVFSMRRAALFSKAGLWGRHRLHLAPESGGRRGLRDGGAALLSPASQADGMLLQGGGQRNGHGREETWPCVALWRGRSDKARPFLTALAPLKAVERPSAFARSAVRRAPERHLDFP